MKNSSTSTRSSIFFNNSLSLCVVGSLLILPILVHAPAAHARTSIKTEMSVAAVPQAWRGKRVLMSLPLRTGTNWNANKDFTEVFLPQAQAALREVLNRTDKFSLLEVRRFNPVLMRAVQDGAATTDDLTALLDSPNVPNAGAFLSKTSFNRAPLQSYSTAAAIGSFVLESVDQSSSGLRLKVTARMYDPGATTSRRALSAIVTVPNGFATGSSRTPAVIAAHVGFDRVVQEFLRYPSERDVPVAFAPDAIAPATVDMMPASSAADVTVDTTVTTTTTSTTIELPGTPITGASTRGLTTAPTASKTTVSTAKTTTSTTPVMMMAAAPVLSIPGLPSLAGITVEVETPPAEVFPVAAPPATTGGGEGTEPVEGAVEATGEEVVEGDAVVTEDAPVEDNATDSMADATSGASSDASSDTASDSDSGSDDSSSSSDSTSSSDGGTGASTGTPGNSGGEKPGGMPGEDPGDDIDVTTTVSPRFRDRAPGETPAFER